MSGNFELFDQDGHLTGEALKRMSDGTLNEEELIHAAEHLGCCMQCADAFAQNIEHHGLERSPVGFEQAVCGRIRSMNLKNRVQYLLYSLRVALAVCAALAIVFSGSLSPLASDPKIASVKAPDMHFVNTVSSELRSFSQNVIDQKFLKWF